MQHTAAGKSPTTSGLARPTLRRPTDLRVSEPDDASEREADRIADAVTGRGGPPSGLSIARLDIVPVQRDEAAPPQSEEEKQKQAADKFGDMLLETPLGRELKDKAERLGESFVASLPGKLVTGATIAGALTALAAAHKELPVGIPDIPLDRLSKRLKGWKLKISYDGPVDQPTNVAGSFVAPVAAPEREPGKPAPDAAEAYRAGTARIAEDQARFREGTKTPAQLAEERAAKQRGVDAWIRSRAAQTPPGLLPGVEPLPSDKAAAAGKAAPGLLGQAAPAPFKLSGEQPKTKEPEDPHKKKDEAGAGIRRKATGPHAVASHAPPIVGDALGGSGRALDHGARAHMERRFGIDFSAVRIHTDVTAERSAQAVNARAYTIGRDIAFAVGQYSPYTAEGQRLLAHELAHVAQQQGGASRAGDLPLVQRKKQEGKQIETPEQTLQKALDGDDDSVRELTASSQWQSVTFTGAQAATLIIHLLDGVTGSDDEEAGLAVLEKAKTIGEFDGTLDELGKRKKFGQLLDDYGGANYKTLLIELSENIESLSVKGQYLDIFIAMWWVQEHEEEAIIILLLNTNDQDRLALLNTKNRLAELRDAIDTKQLSVKFEVIIGTANKAQQADLAAQLRKVFEDRVKKAVAAGTRTQAEADTLLKAAAEELTNELLDYGRTLETALYATDSPDPSALAKINDEFRERLGFLLTRKESEFRLELKYNVEFDRLLEGAYSRSWRLADLKEIDKILSELPPEILHANPNFKRFGRGEWHPEKGGSARAPTISLYGILSLSTTAHEFGHIIAEDDADKLQNEWNKEFKWEILTLADVMKYVPDQKARTKLLENLDEDRRKEREHENDRHAVGDHFYRYDRYGAGYLRHPKNAMFISPYAATDRMDDFAESFEEYLLNPVNLQKKTAGKYTFMRQQVFTRYFFGKQKTQTLDEFDKEAKAGRDGLNLIIGISIELDTRYISKLRGALASDLDAAGQRLETQALAEKPSDKMKRIPGGGAAARDAAKPFRERLAALLKLAAHATTPSQMLKSEDALLQSSASAALHTSAMLLSADLTRSFRNEAMDLIDPFAQRILGGDLVVLPAWPAMDDLTAKYRKAYSVASSHLVRYDKSHRGELDVTMGRQLAMTEEDFLGPTAWAIVSKYPEKDPRRKKIADFAITRRDELFKQGEKLQEDIVAQVKAGIPANKAKLTDPDALVKGYEKDLKAFIKKEGLQIQPKASSTAGRDPKPSPLIANALHGPGHALEPATRRDMEARFGHDFGRVRIHSDAQAAVAARSADALAYTAGHHVVFGQSLYAPTTASGRTLLAHELTHVVQQTAGRDGGHTAAPTLVGPSADAAERQADSVANAIDAGTRLPWTPLASPGTTVQRGFFEWVDDLFGGKDFSPEELKAYVGHLGERKQPLGGLAGDNKARAVVRQWLRDKSSVALDAPLKVLLIKEMQAGFTGDDDERAILDLLNGSDDAELTQIFGSGNINAAELNDDFHGEEWDLLRAFYAKRFQGGKEALLKGQIRPVKKGAEAAKEAPSAEKPAVAPVEDVPIPGRKDYVFLMGKDSKESSNKFYTSAERFFRAHVPGATFITDKPTLAELLAYIDKIKDPAGRIYIVSHANEDGTLSFGLSPGDTNRKLSVAELREALHPKTGPSRLADVTDKIDARTRIRVKGCDIGRTREMVELLDEAFGGLGTVTAPTHEQEYGYDSTEAERAERSARPGIEKAHPTPPPVEASLKGAAKTKAEAARKKELAKREKAIADEVRAAGEKGGNYEAFSGPMFQRPGTKLFNAAELAPEIKRLYGHLGAARQKELATLLTTPDPRTDAVAESNGTVGQRGQRLYRKRTFVFTHNDPQSLDEAVKVFAKSIPKHFTASTFNIGTPVTGPDGTTFKYTLSGRLAPPKQDAQAYTLDFTSEPVPTDAALLSKGRVQVSNPDAYDWRIERSHGSNGKTTLKVIGERVLAYLHHESLDVGPHQHFTRPESDKDFFTTSTFAPDAGAASPSGGKK